MFSFCFCIFILALILCSCVARCDDIWQYGLVLARNMSAARNRFTNNLTSLEISLQIQSVYVSATCQDPAYFFSHFFF